MHETLLQQFFQGERKQNREGNRPSNLPSTSSTRSQETGQIAAEKRRQEVESMLIRTSCYSALCRIFCTRSTQPLVNEDKHLYFQPPKMLVGSLCQLLPLLSFPCMVFFSGQVFLLNLLPPSSPGFSCC